VSLVDALRQLESARNPGTEGSNPKHRRELDPITRTGQCCDIKALADDWHAGMRARGTEEHAKGVTRILDKDAIPKPADIPVKSATAPLALEVLRKTEARGTTGRAETRPRRKEQCATSLSSCARPGGAAERIAGLGRHARCIAERRKRDSAWKVGGMMDSGPHHLVDSPSQRLVPDRLAVTPVAEDPPPRIPE